MSRGKKSLTSKFGPPASEAANAIHPRKKMAQSKQGPFGITKKVGHMPKVKKY
jgi:hypothetical protein